MNENILIVDDEPDILETLDQALSQKGFRVRGASSGIEAIEIFKSEPFDLVLTDIRMPGMNGIELLKELKILDKDIEVIVLTGRGTLENAITALRDDGAFDYLLKPLEQIDELFISVDQALERRGLRFECKALLKKLSEANAELEHRVAERTMQLKETIAMLKAEIAERKRAVEEREKLQRLFQSRKMEAIGSLAGGIAHEFNNILTTIVGNTELAINDIPESHPAMNCLKDIQSASSRAKDSVRQLLGFARKSVFPLQPVHLSPVIREAMILIRASIPGTIEIRENISCESDMVMADSSQINLTLLSLCENAGNALQEQGGVLEVKLENTTLDEKSAARYEGLGHGNYVKMTVRDTGHGIDPKIIDHIFEPYFTTGSLAEATGMGLAVVYGIVKRHNGAIVVESELGKGTVFEVLFPLTEAETEKETPSTSRAC